MVGQGCADALRILRLAWHVEWACWRLLESAIALCHSDAFQYVVGLEQSGTIHLEHSRMFFYCHKEDDSLVHVRKLS